MLLIYKILKKHSVIIQCYISRILLKKLKYTLYLMVKKDNLIALRSSREFSDGKIDRFDLTRSKNTQLEVPD